MKLRMVLYAALVWCLAPRIATADVLYLSDGSIVIATLKSATPDGVQYESFGTTIVLKTDDIIRNEPDLSSLAKRDVLVVLADGSTLKGRISDYDDEIGIFIDISFGTLTLPTSAVKRIVDPERARLYEGTPYRVETRFSYYFPIGSENYDASFTLGGLFQLKTNLVRGLFFGISADYMFMSYKASSDLSFAVYQITPLALYKYLDLRIQKGFVSAFTPYAGLGLGASFVSVTDNREGVYPNDYGDITLHGQMEFGTEIAISQGISATAGGRFVALLQSSGVFMTLNATVSVAYEF